MTTNLRMRDLPALTYNSVGYPSVLTLQTARPDLGQSAAHEDPFPIEAGVGIGTLVQRIGVRSVVE